MSRSFENEKVAESIPLFQLTQFISHRLCWWEFKRFYRYREGMLDGCKSDRCRWLMNWYKNFFCIFFTICCYAPADQPPPTLAEANKILANDESVQCSSKPTGSIKQRLKKILKISGHQQGWPRPLPGAILIPPALLVVADFWFRLELFGNFWPWRAQFGYSQIRV